MTPLLLALLLSQAPAKQKVVATESTTGKAVEFGDFTNKAARVNCVTGCGSGGLTDAQLRASAVPVSVSGAVSVTGTFFQATQPVSGTVAVSTGFLLDTTFTGRINTLGQKTMANSTPVVLASDQSAIPVTGTFFQATQPVSGTVTANQGGSWTVIDTPPTLTKGTQGATGFSTQDLKDAGRTLWSYTADNVVPVLTTDTIVTATKLLGDTSTGSVTTYAVTSGKTLRVTGITITMVPSSTTVAQIRVRLRTNSGGACIASSALVGIWSVSSPPGTIAASAGGVASLSVPFPDGLEFSGATRNVCLSMNALGAAAQLVDITTTGFEY